MVLWCINVLNIHSLYCNSTKILLRKDSHSQANWNFYFTLLCMFSPTSHFCKSMVQNCINFLGPIWEYLNVLVFSVVCYLTYLLKAYELLFTHLFIWEITTQHSFSPKPIPAEWNRPLQSTNALARLKLHQKTRSRYVLASWQACMYLYRSLLFHPVPLVRC